MTHLKVAVFVTCENQDIQSCIEETTHNALRSVGSVDVVRDDSWDYLLRFTAVLQADAFIEIEVKYNWNRYVIDPTSDSTDMTIDQVDWGVFRMPREELSEFCQQQVQTFAKWQKRWGGLVFLATALLNSRNLRQISESLKRTLDR